MNDLYSLQQQNQIYFKLPSICESLTSFDLKPSFQCINCTSIINYLSKSAVYKQGRISIIHSFLSSSFIAGSRKQISRIFQVKSEDSHLPNECQASLVLRFLRPKGISWINYSSPLPVVWKKKVVVTSFSWPCTSKEEKRPWMHREPCHSRKDEGVLFCCPHIFAVSSCPWPVIAHTAMRSLAVLGAQSLNSRKSGSTAPSMQLCPSSSAPRV